MKMVRKSSSNSITGKIKSVIQLVLKKALTLTLLRFILLKTNKEPFHYVIKENFPGHYYTNFNYVV
jgi:hypothetical protein